MSTKDIKVETTFGLMESKEITGSLILDELDLEFIEHSYEYDDNDFLIMHIQRLDLQILPEFSIPMEQMVLGRSYIIDKAFDKICEVMEEKGMKSNPEDLIFFTIEYRDYLAKGGE